MLPHLPQRLILFFLLAIVPIIALTQKNKVEEKETAKYNVGAETIRKEVWAWNKPEFAVRKVPAEYANASKVILARHIEINFDSKLTTGANGFLVLLYRELMATEILRELVKINDKSAIDDYSEISFKQIERRGGLFLDKITNIYVGVRVLKPDGNIKEINTDDFVLTKNESKIKEAKLAIPDLQVGDIIDYFVCKQTSMPKGMSGLPFYNFTLFDDAPILHYSIHGEFGKKYAIEYRCYNNAPDFKISKGDDKENILDLVLKNVPPYSGFDFWTSSYRQLPMIRMGFHVGTLGPIGDGFNPRKPGTVYRNVETEEFIRDELNLIARKQFYEHGEYGWSMPPILTEYYKGLYKNKKNISIDSFAAELFYIFRFDDLFQFDLENDKIDEVLARLQRPYILSHYSLEMSKYFKQFELSNDKVLVTAQQGPRMNEILSTRDINYLVVIKAAKPLFFSFYDAFSPAFYIPHEFENATSAVAVNTKSLKTLDMHRFERSSIDIPGSGAEQNKRVEKLQINFDIDKLQISRTTILKGHFKSDIQKKLVLLEDYYNEEKKVFSLGSSLIDYLKRNKSAATFAEELETAFSLAKKHQRESFLAESREWYDQEITDFTDHKLENLGLRHSNPDFVYSSKFKIAGLVKKAGNNFIIEVGKLQGSPLKIDDEQRKRTLDVYAPFPRSFEYDFSFQIPPGYSVEGVKELNRRVENETGYFIAEATTDGKMVTIKVRKSYNHAFEPASNWNKMLAFIDAANEWTNAKLLLKKK